MQNQVSDNKSSQKPDNSWIIELGKTLALSAFLAFGIRTFVAEARWIPTPSMEPTLHGVDDQWKADKIIVDKLKYRFAGPERGDIIVFNPPAELQLKEPKDAYIKRVIGLPGERVELRGGKVYINNKPLPEKQYLNPGQETSTNVCQGNISFLSQPVTIPSDSYLVLGDNRGSSFDSRCWGVVPKQNIIGRAIVRFWPLDRVGTIDKSPLYPETNP
ncbi:MAG TPA: signal peptidase I [Nostocaceae cyanobacterium]|nr:signal peptidase I [Nostocaceae cyanobacterium]